MLKKNSTSYFIVSNIFRTAPAKEERKKKLQLPVREGPYMSCVAGHRHNYCCSSRAINSDAHQDSCRDVAAS